jgi:hypothetical protein
MPLKASTLEVLDHQPLIYKLIGDWIAQNFQSPKTIVRLKERSFDDMAVIEDFPIGIALCECGLVRDHHQGQGEDQKYPQSL